MNRHWDASNEYTKYDIREYRHWLVTLSTKQHTLGSCIIFCLRSGVWKYSELTTEEVLELVEVKRDLEGLLTKHFNPDHFNYCQYGNQLKVFHEHVIPRYKKPRREFSRNWNDPTFGTIPKWVYYETKESLLTEIKERLLSP